MHARRTRRSTTLALQAVVLAALVGAGFAVSTAVGSATASPAASTTTGTTGTTATATTTTTKTTTTATTTAKTTTTTVAAPTDKSLPGISGTARDGQLLTASNGSWTGSPTSYAYGWLRCDGNGGACGSISGANSRQYTVTTADVGHRLRVEVTATNAGGSGSATSSPTDVVQASGSAPANTKLPSLSGNPQQGATLAADIGTWSGSSPISYDYTWQRCDSAGNNCSTFIAHNSGATRYTLGGADVGRRIRVEVQAKNAEGSSYVYSSPTGVVQPPKTTQSAAAIAVSGVSLPDRLVIDRVSFSPARLRSRNTSLVARFHVADAHGLSVQGALVFALGLPYGWTFNASEQATDANGWATIVIRPTRAMPLRRGELVLFVRARRPGDSLLAGVSTRRLVQERIG